MEKEKNFDYFSLYSSSDLFSYADYIILDSRYIYWIYWLTILNLIV